MEIIEKYKKFISDVIKLREDFETSQLIDTTKSDPLTLLFVLYDIKRASKFLSTPKYGDDYEANKEYIKESRQLIDDKPTITKEEYSSIFSGIKLTLDELINYYNKTGYNEFLTLYMRMYKVDDFNIKCKSGYVKRYWINNMKEYKNLVYDRYVLEIPVDAKTGVTEDFIKATDTIKLQNDEVMRKELPRIVNNNKSDKKVCFISAYNKGMEDLIFSKIERCAMFHVKKPIDITQQLLLSINFYKYVNCETNDDFINLVLSDVRKYIVDAYYSLNPLIKNKRELFYANANIVFDILKKIKSILRNSMFEQRISLPIKSRDEIPELLSKMKSIIYKAIDECGIKQQKKGVDQTVCI